MQAVTGRLLFRVVDGDREYRIFDNGEISGFGENAVVFNCFPLLARARNVRPRVPQVGSSVRAGGPGMERPRTAV